MLTNMKRGEIKGILAGVGVQPSRQLGQNFLTDPAVAADIVAALEIDAGDCVVEVGPGTGALTRHVAGKPRKLVLVEFDARLAAHLQTDFAGDPTVQVIHADAANLDLRPFFREGGVKFLGNLPYSAGGAILKNFFNRPSPVSRGVVMLQKEFVDRMLAGPGSKDYGLLSLRLQSEWNLRRVFNVPPECFVPRPRIDSTVVAIEPLAPGTYPPFDARLFDSLIRRGFSQRRKQLHKQLPEDIRPWPELAAMLGVSAAARGEQLTVRQWIELTRLCDPHPLMDVAQKDDEIFDVVDATDNPVGRERRAVVHAGNLLHRAVHILVFDKHGQVFLQKRSRLKDKHPGAWDSSAAGHLDAGEDYDACAIRELEEELGITGATPRRVMKINASEATGWEHVWLYRVDWNGRIHFPCAEIEAGLWLPPAEIDQWIAARPRDFAPGFIECWKNGVRT